MFCLNLIANETISKCFKSSQIGKMFCFKLKIFIRIRSRRSATQIFSTLGFIHLFDCVGAIDHILLRAGEWSIWVENLQSQVEKRYRDEQSKTHQELQRYVYCRAREKKSDTEMYRDIRKVINDNQKNED